MLVHDRENMNKQERGDLDTICFIEAIFKSESVISESVILNYFMST